jgi:hypothetical protein
VQKPKRAKERGQRGREALGDELPSAKRPSRGGAAEHRLLAFNHIVGSPQAAQQSQLRDMIIPTPPTSIKPQHTGESNLLPPDYSPPAEFEQARLAYDGKHDYEHEWEGDHKDSTSVYSEYELDQWPREQAESLASGSSRRPAAHRASIHGGRSR